MLKIFLFIIYLIFMTFMTACTTPKITTSSEKLVTVTVNDINYQAVFKSDKNTLIVLTEPENNHKLRMKSIAIPQQDIPKVANFMKHHLLATMYEEEGGGIAAIQVGLPIKAFIIDIPVFKLLINDKYQKVDKETIIKELKSGRSLVKKELIPKYDSGKLSHIVKLTKITPKLKDNALVKVEYEKLDYIETKPDMISERNPYFMINPKILKTSDAEIVLDEGCLSVPNELIAQEYNSNRKVKRPLSVVIEYIDELGKKQQLTLDGTNDNYQRWLARAFQHEYDHTEGILFIDKLYIPKANEEL